MKNMNLVKAGITSLAVSMASVAALAPTAANAELSGNIGVHSKYLLRGIFEENDDAAIQGGLDYSNESGFYAGWWASSLGYTYDDGPVTDVTERGFENDIYAGFAGDFGNGIGWDVSLLQYVYINVDDSDLTELLGSLSYGGGYVGFQYLLNDGWWGNSGDVYWKAGYAMDLPSDFGLAFDAGYYTYEEDDNKELGGYDPLLPSKKNVTMEDSGFRHLNITLSHPVANTGADMYVQYTVAGEDRTGADYDDSMVIGFTYDFDI